MHAARAAGLHLSSVSKRNVKLVETCLPNCRHSQGTHTAPRATVAGGAHDWKEVTVIVAAFVVLAFVSMHALPLWQGPGLGGALELNSHSSSLSTQRYGSAVDRRYRDSMLDQNEDDVCV